MLIDIRKQRYGFDLYRMPVKEVFTQSSEIDVLLSQRPDKGGLPPSMLMAYLDKSTPLDLKMQFESLLSSTTPLHGCSTEDEALASVIPKNLSVEQLEDLIEEQNQVINDNSKLNDNG